MFRPKIFTVSTVSNGLWLITTGSHFRSDLANEVPDSVHSE